MTLPTRYIERTGALPDGSEGTFVLGILVSDWGDGRELDQVNTCWLTEWWDEYGCTLERDDAVATFGALAIARCERAVAAALTTADLTADELARVPA